MLKKVIPIVLSLCLILGISVMAEKTVGNENIPNTSSERPMRGDFDPSKIPEGFTPPEGAFTPPQSSENDAAAEITAPKANEGATEENPQATENGEEAEQTQNLNSPFDRQKPEEMGGFTGSMQNGNTALKRQTGFLGFVKTYSTPITSVVLLGLAYLFVVFYKRKHY